MNRNPVIRRGTMLLSFVILCERMCFYGVRACLLFYAASMLEEDFQVGMPDSTAKWFQSYAILLLILPIPIGLIVDKITNQKKGVVIGGVFSFLGFLLMLIGSVNTIMIGVICVAIGTSFIKPSTIVLVGRQFVKSDVQRNLTFILYFLAINIGALLGVLVLASIGETLGWFVSLVLAAGLTGVYTLVFILSKDVVCEVESDTIVKNSSGDKRGVFWSFVILMALFICYDQPFETYSMGLPMQIMHIGDYSLFGFAISRTIIFSLKLYLLLPVSISLFFLIRRKIQGNSNRILAGAFLLLLVAMILTKGDGFVDNSLVLEFSLLPFFLYAIVEAIILPFITSYITWVSSIRYSNTIYGLFFFLNFILSYLLSVLMTLGPEGIYFVFPIIGIVLIVLFGNKLTNLVGERIAE